jgi:homocysteine S-methyltransferase
MTTHLQRTHFPSSDQLVMTDAGLETWLLFDRGIDLPEFAAYPLVATVDGRAALTEYYDHFLAIADEAGTAVTLDAPTWRANPDWATALGHGRGELASYIAASVNLVADARDRWAGDQPFVIGGAVGPRGDGYAFNATDPAAAAAYHSFQIDCMADTPVDIVTAMTIGSTEEAIGIARAAARVELPVVVSFTVETDGRLPSGTPLGDAVQATDKATDGYPTHYMINCAHPTHFDSLVRTGEPWLARVGGLRANASTLSHAELDEATQLDRGDPGDLARRYADLRSFLPALHVVGGCCGTDHRHVAAIVDAITTHDKVSR